MMTYLPEQIDRLALAVVLHTYREAVHKSYRTADGGRIFVPPPERYKARRWWNDNARDWIEILGQNIPVPEIPLESGEPEQLQLEGV
jgi:hypothetical protein